ncbi:MAG: CBS domain-containing protein [Hamadaea sp.]|nr:CBS domain-containing protein [Hamadaea sp.]
MAHKVHEVMTDHPVTVEPGTTLAQAAQLMRERNIGDVIVAEGGLPKGIVTDRDIVVRAVAEGRDSTATTVGEICTGDVATVGPDDDADSAVALMRSKAIRRLPVVDHDRLVGVLSLGDMAVDRDPRSALADISAATPNR